MGNLIAVNDPFTILHINGATATLNISCLKREALMFNRIYIPTLTASFFSNNFLYKQQPDSIADLQWLLEQGIVWEPKEVVYDDGMEWDIEQFASTLIGMKFGEEGVQSLNTPKIAKAVMVLAGIGTRRHAIKLHEKGLIEAYPVVTSIQAPPDKTGIKSNVLEFAINELPVPDDLTPWEQIVEFREDPDSEHKFLKLKNWMNEIARMELKPNEVEDKLMSLISDYQSHMKVHKIKTRLDAFKTIILAEAGFITGGWLTGLGALPGLFGMVATPLYTIKQRQVTLLEEEQKAPGKEVAYIVKAKNTFKTPSIKPTISKKSVFATIHQQTSVERINSYRLEDKPYTTALLLRAATVYDETEKDLEQYGELKPVYVPANLKEEALEAVVTLTWEVTNNALKAIGHQPVPLASELIPATIAFSIYVLTIMKIELKREGIDFNGSEASGRICRLLLLEHPENQMESSWLLGKDAFLAFARSKNLENEEWNDTLVKALETYITQRTSENPTVNYESLFGNLLDNLFDFFRKGKGK